jgi:hypothetical protein
MLFRSKLLSASSQEAPATFSPMRLMPILSLAWFAGCANQPEPLPESTREALLDPETCRTCHADHVRDWSQSMHAYASRDPVFLAMNRRGQEETRGLLGDFCVRCHAPMAVLEGYTTDGLNLETLPSSVQGVTCYFCHNAKAVEGSHNNPLLLDDDSPAMMRGGILDPVSTQMHQSAASPLFTGSDPRSADLCGACHDIELGAPFADPPVALERTFQEWKGTLFAPRGAESETEFSGVTCIGCHMPVTGRGPVAPSGPRDRFLHDHTLPGVDVDLGLAAAGAPDPNRDRVQSFLDTTLRIARLCVEYPLDTPEPARIRIKLDLDNVGAGHNFPSGASQDRRVWVDLRVLYEGEERYASGAQGLASTDPDFWVIYDAAFKKDGTPAHMFWDVARIVPGTISGPITNVVGAPGYDATHLVRSFPKAANTWIDVPFDRQALRVTVRVHVQPVGFDVLDDLIDSGHLSPWVRDAMPSFKLLPNRSLARPALIEKHPELARFSDVTFEWSDFSLSSPYFSPPESMGGGSTTKTICAGMNRPSSGAR